MPVMNGVEFIDQLQTNEKWLSIPIVVLTSKDLTVEEQTYLNPRVESIYQKKPNKDVLISHLRQLIKNGSSYID